MVERSKELQNQAWNTFNQAFQESGIVRQSLQDQGRALYQDAISTEIQAMDSRSERQNRLIDMALGEEVTLPQAPARDALPDIEMYG